MVLLTMTVDLCFYRSSVLSTDRLLLLVSIYDFGIRAGYLCSGCGYRFRAFVCCVCLMQIVLYLDVNECNNATLNICDQVCINEVPHFSCQCLSGYTLEEDGVHCKGKLGHGRSI